MTTAPGDAAPPPRRTDARLNRDRPVAAAREVFAASGPGAPLHGIARRADVGPGTLHRRFPHRQAPLAAVLTDRVESLRTRAGEPPAVEGFPADEAPARWASALFTHAREQHGIGGALLPEDPYALGADRRRLVLDAAAGVLSHARREGTARPDLTAAGLVRLVTGVAPSTVRGTGPQQADRLLPLVLDAVRATPGGSGPSR